EPADPISFAPYYAIRKMTDPFGADIGAHAVFTINTIGDMNVPLNAGIAFARATGALPFLRPEDATKYPEYADYATPLDLYTALGEVTPNQDLINSRVLEGVTNLARHPAQAACATSANAAINGTYLSTEGEIQECFPAGCATTGATCLGRAHCDTSLDQCV